MSSKDEVAPAMDGDREKVEMLMNEGLFPGGEALLRVVGTTNDPRDLTGVARELQRLHAIAVTIPGASVGDISVATNFDVSVGNHFDVTLDDETVRVTTEGGDLGMIKHRDFGLIYRFGDEELTPLDHKGQLENLLWGKDYPWGNDDDPELAPNPDPDPESDGGGW